ncbi:hypothetical protein TgHK011_009490 [Trichoderma gracile]|nr:hypothetical protein TgHK011_009490 [Trichoderma gracile]
MSKTLPHGLYAPLPVFFNSEDEIDVTAPGVLPVVSASMGEAVHLTPQERIKLIQTLRSTLDSAGLQKTPIVAGVGGSSTRETIQLARDAASAGADFALVIVPGYWAGYLKGNPTAVRRFFVDVAAGSPIPVVIYNFPPVAGGIDLDSDDVAAIARQAPNVCGVMLSDGNVGKLAQIAALLDGSSFTTLAGLIDFLLPSVVVGSAGAISPLPNIAPKFSMEMWEMTQNLQTKADISKAQKAQGAAALAESALLKSGVPGLKGLLNSLSAGALQLPLGQLTDLLGRKAFFIVGMVGFSVSSLILGFSQNPFWMNILCGFLGLFSAVIVPPAIGILGAAYSEPSKRKNWAFACFSAGNPVGFGLGSIIMGISAKILDWRAGFFFFTILWGLLAIASVWVVPSIEAFEPGPFGTRLKVALRRFDVVGTAMTIVGVGLFTTGLTLGPVDGWKTGHVIAMLVVGFSLLVGFVVWERRCPHPLMPLHIWRDKGFAFLMPVSIFGVMSMLSSNFWLALFLQEVHRRSALTVAVDLLPQVISALISNVVAANILHRVNNSFIMAFGAAMYLVANLLLAVQRPQATYWAFIFPSLLTNVMGLDLQFNVTNSLAGGIFNMFIRLGTTIVFGLSTAVYSSVKNSLTAQDDAFAPYKSAFYVSLGFAALACLFVPFLRIGTQGNSPKEE